MVIDNQKKELPCGWLPQGSFFATGEVASGRCHNGGCFYRPSLCRISVPRILPSTLVSRESITSPMVIVTPSLPCRIGLVRAVAASVYHKTHEKIPLRLVNAVGFFVCNFIRARSRRPPPCARPRLPLLRARRSAGHSARRSSRRTLSRPPPKARPVPCGR